MRRRNYLYTDLMMANLYQADLHSADLQGVNFHQAKLSQADLSGAEICRTSFYEADLSGAEKSVVPILPTSIYVMRSLPDKPKSMIDGVAFRCCSPKRSRLPYHWVGAQLKGSRFRCSRPFWGTNALCGKAGNTFEICQRFAVRIWIRLGRRIPTGRGLAIAVTQFCPR